MKIWKLLAGALVLATVGAGPAGAEVYNQFCKGPSFSATVFIVVFKGDITGDLNLAVLKNDPTTNPFAYVNQKIIGSGTSNVTASYDSTTNATTVTYSGSNPIKPSYSFSYGPTQNGMPHFGLDGTVGAPVSGGGPAFTVLSQKWSDGGSNNTPLPSLTLDVKNPPASGKVKFISFFADVTSGGQTSGQWFEIPYTPGTAPKLVVTNYTNMPETLSNVGYVLSPTQIPLDQLNFSDYPPPGSPNSPYTPLPQYDGQSLGAGSGKGDPGGTFTTQGLPEPSSLISLATGLLVVSGYLGHRRHAARRVRAAAGA